MIQKFIKKNAVDFYSALAFGSLDLFAAGASFTDERKDLDIMNNPPGEEHQHGLYVSSIYGQVKKSLASANNFKMLMSELNYQRENEIPGRITFIPPAFQEKMNKGETRDLCRRWARKGAPPAYLVCASYAALMGNQEIIPEQLCRQLRYLLATPHLWAIKR